VCYAGVVVLAVDAAISQRHCFHNSALTPAGEILCQQATQNLLQVQQQMS